MKRKLRKGMYVKERGKSWHNHEMRIISITRAVYDWESDMIKVVCECNRRRRLIYPARELRPSRPVRRTVQKGK